MFKTQYLFKWMMFPCLRVSEISFTLRGKRKLNTNSEAMSRALILVIKASTACWNVIFTVIIFLSQWNTYFASVFLPDKWKCGWCSDPPKSTLSRSLYATGKVQYSPCKKTVLYVHFAGTSCYAHTKKKKKKASHMY